MGEKLTQYFTQARAKGGIQGQVKLAMITKMTSAAAKEATDTPELIKKFEEAIKQI
jgi:hypothetical protein